MKPIAIRALAACGLFCLVCPASAFEAYNIVPMWIGHEDRQASNAVDLASRTDVRLSLYSLSLHPEGRPAQAKADRLVDSYRAYARALRGTDVKAGVLVQSILGHWPRNDKEIEPWTRTVDQDGRPVRFCPLDPGFGAYIDRVFTDLARERPAFIMTDDDIRAYSHGCECFCERHVALFNARRGTAYDADALRAAVDSGGPGDPDYDAFMAMQREMVEDGVIGRIRRAIDSVDPSIPAGVCIGGEEHFFAEALARKIAAKGQRPVMRCATGSYFERMTAARFPSSALRQLAFAEAFRGSGIDLLDEADTCPHNLWSKSGRAFFTHLVSAAFAGYAGAKTWYVNAEKPGGLAVARQYADELERGGRLLSELLLRTDGSVLHKAEELACDAQPCRILRRWDRLQRRDVIRGHDDGLRDTDGSLARIRLAGHGVRPDFAGGGRAAGRRGAGAYHARQRHCVPQCGAGVDGEGTRRPHRRGSADFGGQVYV